MDFCFQKQEVERGGCGLTTSALNLATSIPLKQDNKNLAESLLRGRNRVGAKYKLGIQHSSLIIFQGNIFNLVIK